MYVKTQALKPHPLNEWIYGDEADEHLIESIRDKGILTPLLITQDNHIISGHRRWQAAQAVNMVDVPVSVFGSTNETDILEALIESNQQRAVKHSQKGKAYIALLGSMESYQGNNQHTASNKFLLDAPRNVRAAKTVGLSQPTADKIRDVLECAEVLQWETREEEANYLIQYLDDNNPSKARDACQKQGYIKLRDEIYEKIEEAKRFAKVLPSMEEGIHYERYMAGNNPTSHIIVTLDQYKTLDDEQKQAVLNYRVQDAKSMNRQNSSEIEWAQWSWNPITGCKHECPYCYAREIATTGRNPYQQGFQPSILPARLDAPYNVNVPKEAKNDTSYKNVFVCSMADLFGRWVPTEWIQAVLDVCEDNPQWNFLFLTKFPIRMSEFNFPDNCWVGTTVDHQARVKNAEKAFAKVNAKVKWLSIEPMLTPLEFSDLSMFQWIVLGGSSSTTTDNESLATPEWRPPFAWIANITAQAWNHGVDVYFKDNLLSRVKQFPMTGEDTETRQLPEALRYLPDVE